MKKNVGTIDKIVRLILAAVLLIIAFATNLAGGVWSYILVALAAILIFTSLISFCPIYWPFGLSTRAKEDKPNEEKK